MGDFLGLAEAVHRRLDEGARVQVRELLGRAQPLGQRRGRFDELSERE